MPRKLDIVLRLTAVALFLAACGELPRPFQSGDAIPPASIEDAKDFDGISVGLVEGAPEHVALPLAETISDVLQGTGIPATASDNFRGQFSLRGFVADPGPPSPKRPAPIADVTWRLVDRSGKTLVEFLQRINGPSDGWISGDPAMLKQVAVDVTPTVADAYRNAAEHAAPAAGARLASVSLTAIGGLTADRYGIMVRAIRIALSERGLDPVKQAADAEYSLAGAFDIGPAQSGRRAVGVTWTLRDKDGKELGKVNQENFLPEPMSLALWRQISAAIAAGAGDGLADLVRRTGGR